MKRGICFFMSDSLSYRLLLKEHLLLLRKLGADVTCLYGGESERLVNLKEMAKFVDVGIKRRPNLIFDLIALINAILHFFKYRYNVVVYSTPKAMLIGAISTFLTFQKKRICLVRGRAYENKKGLARKLYLLLDYLSFCLSTDIYFISESLLDEYRKDFKLEYAKVIGPGSSKGVNTKIFRPLSKDHKLELRDKWGVSKSALVVSVVGRLCTDKGSDMIRQLLRVLQEDNVHFIFAGEVEDKIGKELYDLIKTSDKYHYYKHIDEVNEIFQLSDVNLFLSSREGFGNVPIEAGACGIPTLAYDVVGVRDSVIDGETGVLLPKDATVQDIVEGIYYLGSNNEIKIKCAEKIKCVFSEDIVLPEYFRVIYRDGI